MPPVITDLGPANDLMYCLMSGIQVGDTLYIGSRNLAPAQVLAYHAPTRRVVGRRLLGPGKFVQALAADGHRALYAGIVSAHETGPGEHPNLYRWDLTDPTPRPDIPGVATIPGLDVRALAVAPDGVVYAVGKQPEPGLWEYRPDTGAVRLVAVPDPATTQARGVAATDTHVYYGSGSNLLGGAGASRAGLYAVDRESGAVTDILPPALAADPAVKTVAVIGDHLFVGTQGSPHGHVAVLRLDDPADHRVLTVDAGSAGSFLAGPDGVYLDAGRILRYADGTLTPVADLGDGERWGIGALGRGGRWGLGYSRGELLAVSAYGAVDHHDLATGVTVHRDLVEAGAPAEPQLGMSLAAGDGRVYVGGNGGVVEHDLTTGTRRRLLVPGEAKSMRVVDGTLHLSVYNGQGIWRHRPGGVPERAVALPAGQNRPQGSAWDATTGTLLVATQNDTSGGGALSLYRPGDGTLTAHVDPFDPYQMVRAVAAADGVAYLGGWNRYPVGPRGELLALDIATGERRWRTDPALGSGISTLATHRGRLYGITMAGTLFVVSTSDGELLHSAPLGALVVGMARLLVTHGTVYGGSSAALFRVDPDTYAVSTVVGDLDGQWYSGATLAADESGALYTLRGRHLLRVVP
ncbi:outer membrane protein assembly factor BamB family protein [Actinocatenispora rupis]|uniref:Pyrrolo-quinoline quinone repeat domain-containing protein n=1 Tax=Actinocatenispora rupis TaxID=519421 RepID=A0A8J3NCX5_9ACTN|nr:PQQ-binding-like beta-propeller repeat protein [Actinocatenispora rupis]GID12262.1 hypothetical protein Aru02nite_31510 [Actinocatenispora rupis]